MKIYADGGHSEILAKRLFEVIEKINRPSTEYHLLVSNQVFDFCIYFFNLNKKESDEYTLFSRNKVKIYKQEGLTNEEIIPVIYEQEAKDKIKENL